MTMMNVSKESGWRSKAICLLPVITSLVPVVVYLLFFGIHRQFESRGGHCRRREPAHGEGEQREKLAGIVPVAERDEDDNGNGSGSANENANGQGPADGRSGEE